VGSPIDEESKASNGYFELNIPFEAHVYEAILTVVTSLRK
jgi:hypothetical protein